MKKIISFSLYGNNPKYVLGMIENLRIAKEYWSDWEVKIFCGADVDLAVRKRLRRLEGTVIQLPPTAKLGGLFWRYLAIQSRDFSHVIFRDSDSRLSLREKILVDQWICESRTLHIIRDHPHHSFPILGGLWGVTEKVHKYEIPWNEMTSFPHVFGADQDFLARHVYSKLRQDSTIHDSYFFLEKRAIRPPEHSSSCAFVGESFNADNEPDRQKRNLIEVFRQKSVRQLLFRLQRTLVMRRYVSQVRN